MTPWTAAHQASLSITNSQSLLKLMPVESVMPSNHLVLCHVLFLLPSISPRIRVFFTSNGQSTGVSASASFLPMNIQDWILSLQDYRSRVLNLGFVNILLGSRLDLLCVSSFSLMPCLEESPVFSNGAKVAIH